MITDYLDSYRELLFKVRESRYRTRVLLFSLGIILVVSGLATYPSTRAIAAIASVFFVATGAQMVLYAAGVRSELLGTNPVPEAAVPTTEQLELRRAIGGRIAIALGLLKYSDELDNSQQSAIVANLTAATDLVLASTDTISRDEFDELYLPLLEKSAALQAQGLDRQGAITVLQEFQQRLGFPSLEYDGRITRRTPISGEALSDLRILVLDDDANILRLISHYLTSAGAEVLTASSVYEAEALVQAEEPDVILSDLVLGKKNELSGHDFIKRLRSIGIGTPVVALTAHGASRSELSREGFASLIPKPFTQDDLTMTLLTLPPVARLRVKKQEAARLPIRRSLQE